jgi:predicted Zn-dependent protease with MMP-like domain
MDDLMDRMAFEALVNEALDSLPPEMQEWLDNVAIVIADWPTREHLGRARPEHGTLLLGLYLGVPKTHRGVTYGEIVPDRILIFQGPIEMIARTPEQIRQQVRKTVLHEIGHHLGMNEGELRDAGV